MATTVCIQKLTGNKNHHLKGGQVQFVAFKRKKCQQISSLLEYFCICIQNKFIIFLGLFFLELF